MGFVEGLEQHTADTLRAAGRRRRYPKGSLLFAEGDPAHEVLLVTDGAVKVVVTAATGREVVLDVLEGGSLLGELTALDGGSRSATVLALTPVEVLAIPQQRFLSLVDDNPALARALLTLLATRVRGASRRQLEFGATDALGRVCQRLVDMTERYGCPDATGHTVITTPVSQQDLASWAGLSREAVVKGLRSLRNLGWVETDGRRVTILDGSAVRQRALQ